MKKDSKNIHRSVKFSGQNLTITPKDQLITQLSSHLDTSNTVELVSIATLNPEQVVLAYHNQKFQQTIGQFATVVADGIGIVWAVRVQQGHAIERIAGIDLAATLVRKALTSNRSVFFLGAAPGIAARAAEHFLSAYPKSATSATITAHSGFKDVTKQTDAENKAILKAIRMSKAKLLLVAYGAPWQEQWIIDNKTALETAGVRIAMVVGGSFDVWAGTLQRAPKVVQNIGFEWMWRLFQEPSRWKRQLKLAEFFWKEVVRKFAVNW